MQYIDTFSGNGTQTVFLLTGIPIDPSQTAVQVDLVPKNYGSDFDIQTHYVIFIDSPNIGFDNIKVEYQGNPI